MAGSTIRGVVGLIRWGYYHAAAINGYTVTLGANRAWRLTATVVTVDRFKIAQRPLVFVAPHQRGEWTWPIEELDLQAGVLRARLGALIEEAHPHGIPLRPA